MHMQGIQAAQTIVVTFLTVYVPYCAFVFVRSLTGKVSVKSIIIKFGTERFVLAGESVTPGQLSTFVCRLLGCFCLMI